MKSEKSVSEYMRREIDTIRIILGVISETEAPAPLSEVAVDRLALATRRLEQSLQYLTRGV